MDKMDMDRALVGLECLPQHMVPQFFQHVEDWPRSPTGKLDRRQLREQAEKLLDLQAHEAELEARFSEPHSSRRKNDPMVSRLDALGTSRIILGWLYSDTSK